MIRIAAWSFGAHPYAPQGKIHSRTWLRFSRMAFLLSDRVGRWCWSGEKATDTDRSISLASPTGDARLRLENCLAELVRVRTSATAKVVSQTTSVTVPKAWLPRRGHKSPASHHQTLQDKLSSLDVLHGRTHVSIFIYISTSANMYIDEKTNMTKHAPYFQTWHIRI